MSFEALFGPQIANWVVIPLLIFLARVLDVSIGTVRVIFITRGMRLLAPLFGFCEVLIWLVVIGHVLSHLTHWINYIAYAAGFATGNYVGMAIEHRIAIGKAIVRVITREPAENLIAEFRRRNFILTTIEATGNTGPVKLLFMVVARTQLAKIIDLVKQFQPRALYTIEDVRFVREGLAPPVSGGEGRFIPLWRWFNRVIK